MKKLVLCGLLLSLACGSGVLHASAAGDRTTGDQNAVPPVATIQLEPVVTTGLGHDESGEIDVEGHGVGTCEIPVILRKQDYSVVH